MPPELPSTSPRRRTLAAVLLFAMTVLAALAGTGHGPPVWIAGLAAWGAAVLLWPQLARAQKRQALLLAGAGAVAFGVALGRGGSPSLLGLLTQNTALLGMLAAVSFLRLLRTPEAGSAGLPKGRGALWRTLGAVHVLGAVINLSAVFIMADRIGPDGKPRQDQAAVLVRAFLAAALWSPFFAATAVALTYAPGASPLGLAASGMALAVVLLWLAGRDTERSSGNRAADFIGYPMQASALKVPAVLAAMILLAALGIHAVITIAMASAWLAPLQPEPTLLALVFVQSWAIGLAAGPMSGIHLALQGRYGLSAAQLARANVRYCLQAYAAAVVWLAVIGSVLGVRLLPAWS